MTDLAAARERARSRVMHGLHDAVRWARAVAANGRVGVPASCMSRMTCERYGARIAGPRNRG